jgi:hypothetical protein
MGTVCVLRGVARTMRPQGCSLVISGVQSPAGNTKLESVQSLIPGAEKCDLGYDVSDLRGVVRIVRPKCNL